MSKKFFIIAIGFLMVVLSTRIFAESSNVSESGIDELLSHSLFSWETLEAQGRTISQAKRLSSNFSLQEEFSSEGRLLARLRKDGSRENFYYGEKKGMVFVWVSSGDGKFKEERLYSNNLLRAVLYADGSLKTLQHVAPLRIYEAGAENNRKPALFVVLSSSQKSKILIYNQLGKLIAVYLPDGTELMMQTQAFTEDLGQVVNIEDLEIKQRQ